MKEAMKLLIQFPTRQRPEKFLGVLRIYTDFYLKDRKNTVIHISCDADDFTMNNPKMIDRIYQFEKDYEILLSFEDNKSKIQAVNRIPDIPFEILLLASDDMIPQVKGYDEIIRKDMAMYFPDLDGVLHYNDGFQGENLNTLSIMGWQYYQRFHYIYHPGYISLFADNEFMEVSRRLGKAIYIDRVIIKHEHPDANHQVEFDGLYQKNDQFTRTDQQTWTRRKEAGYPC